MLRHMALLLFRFSIASRQKALVLALGLPVTNVPEIGHRHVRERQSVQVRRWPELRRQRRRYETAPFLALPDEIPPALVGFDVALVFGSARIGHLRSLLVADAGVDVARVIGAQRQDVEIAVDQSLRDADPV